ncbi:MAG: winged helix-turn-helix domain-containing protein [Tepidiformaceae bacterium]
MKLAIVSDDAVAAGVLAFAAERRGHQTVCLDRTGQLFERLPFEPSLIVVSVNGREGPPLGEFGRMRSVFPNAAVFVTVEKPRQPLPLEMLKAGAHEVIAAPYNQNELVLRAETWLSAHAGSAGVTDALKLSDLEVALERYHATKNGNVLQLTKLELRLLYCLCEHHPHVAPLERLLTFGWDTLGDPDAALLKTHISHIRKKLSEAGGVPFEILSRQTVGYVLRVE